MTGFVAETGIAEIARILKDKKSQGLRVGLLLGHRAGALFHDNNLYEILKRRTMAADELSALLKRGTSTGNDISKMANHIQLLDKLSDLDKFRECYSFLGKHFSEIGVQDILFSALTPTRYREEDKLMARLIKTGFFDTIITTNIEVSLEDACVLLGMKEDVDYQVIICGLNEGIVPGQSSSRGGQIIKVFGDFVSLEYKTAGNEFNLEADQQLKKFLVSRLARDVIVLGFDPTWDRPIEWAFQETGGMLWYVNEEQPLKNTHLAHILNQRGGKYLVGQQWNYSSFLGALSDLLERGVKREAETGSSLPSPLSQSQTRKKAFISYSRRDSRHMERLLTHLRGYLYTGSAENVLDIWVDTRIPIGTDWKEEIRSALASAKIAILLISADFLASDFIREYELPVLLEAAKSGEIKLLPVILGPSAFERTALHRYQVAENSFSQPLTRMKTYERDVVWKKLAEQIVDMLDLQK